MSKRDYYEVLGVSRNSSTEEIKKAYRKIAIKFHPDKNPGDAAAEDKFKEAAEAYDALGNPDKKARYDRFGHQGMNGGGGGGFQSADDIFSHFGDIFGGGFGGGGGSPFDDIFGGGRGGQRQKKGSSVRIKLKLTLQEIAHGVEKKIKVKRQVLCDTCDGSGAKDAASKQTCKQCNGNGQVRRVTNTMLGQMVTTAACPSCNGQGSIITDPCKSCSGEGVQMKEDVTEIKLPAGIEDGMQLSMAGKGNYPPRGGVAGDLLILIEEEEHKYLKREGKNVHYDLCISFPDAVLGTTVEVPTIDGSVKVPIEAGTQGGKILRLRGKGIRPYNTYETGDQLIHVNVWIPQKLTKDERKEMERLKGSDNFAPDLDKQDRSFFDKVKEFFH
ncbi:molecular chaperone DnaJ [Bernardetia sp. OM2101]|uniref:molecular chaperone DnaJ n=1 Tax=Bernardetia sp. OM2101 TaxID=3344876 RepID=UPI0035D0F61B